MKSNHVITFGCRLNTYESAVISELSEKAGISGAIFVNTCSVTNEAERQARQAIRKLRREHPHAPIIVTGCAAQIQPKMFSSMPEVTHVLGNQEKMNPDVYAKISQNPTSQILVNDIASITETASHLVSNFEGRVRAFIQVQNGCNHRCTFCIIPLGRGPSRSVPLGEIVTQIRHLLEQGFVEFVLTGVDLTAYGEDLPGSPTLGQTVRRLLALLPSIQRLRISSLDPVEIDDDLWRLWAEDLRVMPHLHLSFQAGDDMILKRMKRRHLSADIREVCQKIRNYRPDASIGADIIAGFPTETEERFQNTRNLLEECDISFLHVFPYSPRPETPAARMPQVPGTVIKERAAQLRKMGENQQAAFALRFVGKVLPVLFEEKTETEFLGKTEHYLPVRIPLSSDDFRGRILPVRILSANSGTLKAEAVT